MRREKFTYNTQTLRYEKVVEPLSVTILRICGFVCAAVLTGFIFMVLAHRYFPSPNEKALKRELDQLRTELALAGDNFDELSGVLGKIQERDAYAHRMLFAVFHFLHRVMTAHFFLIAPKVQMSFCLCQAKLGKGG